MDHPERNRYAGDEAWREWFAKCSAARCGEATARRLREQITSAMFSRLARLGLRVEDSHGDDPVAFFDSYFALKGSRDAPKPLKAYFLYRINATGIRLVDFVCGTLFGSMSGRVHDIVVEWVATLKGWRPRSLRGADGRRHFVWESAGDEGVASLEMMDAAAPDPADFVDEEPLRCAAERVLDAVSRKLRVEKGKAALLLYVTAQDIPLTEAAVLEGLRTAKSRAYKLKDMAMDELGKLLRKEEQGATTFFARIFIETCRCSIPQKLRDKLEGGQL